MDHVAPALVVRKTVPLVPLTHMTWLGTGARPRNCWVEFVGVSVHVRGLCGCAAVKGRMARNVVKSLMMECGRMGTG